MLGKENNKVELLLPPQRSLYMIYFYIIYSLYIIIAHTVRFYSSYATAVRQQIRFSTYWTILQAFYAFPDILHFYQKITFPPILGVPMFSITFISPSAFPSPRSPAVHESRYATHRNPTVS